MAQPKLNVDVEYAQIEIAGVWYSVDEVNQIMARLRDMMLGRQWYKPTAGEAQQTIAMLDEIIGMAEHPRISRDMLLEECKKRRKEFREIVDKEARSE